MGRGGKGGGDGGRGWQNMIYDKAQYLVDRTPSRTSSPTKGHPPWALLILEKVGGEK